MREVKRREIKMNKQGQIFHWILFSIFIAIGILFFFSPFSQLDFEPKGIWHTSFLKENYLEAEKELLKSDIILKKETMTIARELGNNGGFSSEEISGCGKIDNVNLWNSKNQWCVNYPEIEQKVLGLIAAKLTGFAYSELKFTRSLFSGKGEKKEVKTKNAVYKYDTSFVVDLKYLFSEYYQLIEEAKVLVNRCQGTENVVACLNALTKPIYWKYGPCTEEKLPRADAKQVVFCVISPSNDNIWYNIALDFSAAGAEEAQNIA